MVADLITALQDAIEFDTADGVRFLPGQSPSVKPREGQSLRDLLAIFHARTS